MSHSLCHFYSQTSPHSCPNYSGSLYAQPSLKPHHIAVPNTLSVCMHGLITNLTQQLSHSLCQSVFTAQSQTSPQSCPTHSVSLYSQPNYKLHPTPIPLTTSVCIQNTITKLTPHLSHSLRHYL
jgi:hypothetical protein